MIAISRPVRLAVRQEFVSQFNAQLALACAACGVTAFVIDFARPGKNYFDGPVVLDLLLDYLEENPSAIPALCLYGDGASTQGFTHPRLWSGIVSLGGAVFVRYALDTTDFESLIEAVEAAMVGIIHESDTDSWAGATYRDDLQIKPGDLVFHNGSFYRAVQFQMSFQI